mmetsp:Transcript_30130/g.64364  ORF Transcript_30130/g.64364 Transcript_30130/m.64364 type:complete len:243 (+) Transcript_30130:555-1283(+)
MLFSVMVRMVPPMVVSSGITLKASPALNCVTETTFESKGEDVRDTSVCRATMAAEAATTGSRPRCGMAPCVPFPLKTHLKKTALAMMVPGREATMPVSTLGHTWNPKMALMSRRCSRMCRAPAPPSSAGWKASLIVPRPSFPSACRPVSRRAAPRSIVVCTSCPHACMRPGWVLRKYTSASSSRGSASISARSATTGASPDPITPTTPVPPMPAVKGTPSAASSRCTTLLVSNSLYMSSGFW